MTPQEEQEGKRQNQQAAVRQAWQELALDPNFRLVFECDLQVHFNLHKASFDAGSDFNPYAAAQRDGQKQVISHIFRRIARAEDSLDDDSKLTKPTQAA